MEGSARHISLRFNVRAVLEQTFLSVFPATAGSMVERSPVLLIGVIYVGPEAKKAIESSGMSIRSSRQRIFVPFILSNSLARLALPHTVIIVCLMFVSIGGLLSVPAE